jgi:uncharacterized membrane protein HdeD (DUF308 family)
VTRRERWQTLAAVGAVLLAAGLHALMAPAASPWIVNAAVLGAVAVCAYVATGNALHNREIRRREREDDPQP